MQIWHEVVPRACYNKMTDICLNIIKSERNHQQIDTEIIKNIIQIYSKKEKIIR